MMKRYTTQEKEKIVTKIQELRKQGVSLKDASRQTGVAIDSFRAWEKKFQKSNVIIHTPSEETTKRKYVRKVPTSGDSVFVIVANSSNLKQIMASLQ
jgi:lambda repressor-like predicted transcriptional regulator